MAHRLAGSSPAMLLAAGWSLLALSVVPDLRDRMAGALLDARPATASEFLPSDPVEWAIALSALTLCAVGLILGLRQLARADVEAWTERKGIGALLFVGALAALSILANGEPTIMDAKSHVARGWLFTESFRAGTIPVWTDFWYTGLPADLHYPPLSHIVSGLLGTLGWNAFTAVKLTACGSVIAATVGFGLLGTELYGSRRAGLLVALAGGLSPTLRASWMWEGRLPGLVALAIFPWLLLAVERIVNGRGTYRTAIALGWAILGLVLAHVGQARVALQIAVAYALVRIVALWLPRANEFVHARERWVRTLHLSIGFVFGCVLAACVSFPMLQESGWVNQIETPKLFSPRIPSPSGLASVFLWNPRGVRYAGLSILILAVLGIGAHFRRSIARGSSPHARENGRERLRHPIGPLVMIALLLLPMFLAEPRSRGLDYFFAGGALIAGSVAIACGRRVWFAAVLLLLVDLLPFQLQSTYSAHRADRNRTYDWLERHLEHGRLLELPADTMGNVRPGHWYFAPARSLPTLGGPFIQGVPEDFRFAAAAIDTVGFALRDHGALSNELQRLLAFHGVEAVLLMGPRGPIPPKSDLVSENTTGSTANRDELSRREEPPVLWIPRASFLHALRPTAAAEPRLPHAAIVSRGLPLDIARASAREQLAWLEQSAPVPIAVRVTRKPNTLILEAIEEVAGPARIARASYPGTRIEVDGAAIDWKNGPLGGIRVDLPAGWRQIVITTPMSSTRSAMLAVSTVLLAASGLLLSGIGRPRGRKPALAHRIEE